MLKSNFSLLRNTTIVFIVVMTATKCFADSPNGTDREAKYRKLLAFNSLVQGSGVEPKWTECGDEFWFVARSPGRFVVRKVDPASSELVTDLLDSQELEGTVADLLEERFNADSCNDIVYRHKEQTVEFKSGHRHIRCKLDDFSAKILQAPTTPAETLRSWTGHYPWMQGTEVASPDEKWLAGIEEHNVYLRATSEGEVLFRTTDGEENNEYQLIPNWLGNTGVWSSDGRYLAVKKVDYRDVPKVPLISPLEPTESATFVAYSTAFSSWPKPEIRLIDVSRLKEVNVTIDHIPGLLDVLKWHDRSGMFYVHTANRYHSDHHLLAIHPENGSVRNVLKASEELAFRKVEFLNESERFVLVSEIDGLSRLLLYDLSGKLLVELTADEFRMAEIIAIDESKEWVYFTQDATENVHLTGTCIGSA